MVSASPQTVFESSNPGEFDARSMEYVGRAKRNAYVVLLRKSEERNHLADLGLDGRIILKCILKIMGGRRLDSSGFKTGTSSRLL